MRINRCGDQAFITPQALISVLKVDSVFSSRLLPESQISACISSLKLVLHNHLHYAGNTLTGEMADLALDTSTLPDDHPWLSVSLSPVSVGVSVWPQDKGVQLVQFSVKSKISVEYVDYAFLGLHHLVKPVEVDVWLQQQESQLDMSVKTRSVDAAAGPFFLHTQSYKLWTQVLNKLNESSSGDDTLTPLSHIIIVIQKVSWSPLHSIVSCCSCSWFSRSHSDHFQC